MKKFSIAIAVILLSALAFGSAHAETCYRLTPFVDVLRLNVEISEGATGSAHHLVYGNWITGSYTLPVVGARELNRGSTSTRRLGIHGTNNTAAFGNNPDCLLDGIPGGAWFLNCDGGTGARFRNQGTSLTPISCPGLAPSTAYGAGPEAGNTE
jgi:hypothetical protein